MLWSRVFFDRMTRNVLGTCVWGVHGEEFGREGDME
jgi:hypothetical protein